MRRKLIYFAPETRGGLADYAWAQAEALSKQGVDLIFLTRPSFDRTKACSFRVIDGLKEDPQNLSAFRWIRRYQHLQTLLKNLAILRGLILSLHVKEVIWSSFFEYGAPFWGGYFQDLRRHGVRMAAILHDPVRDYRIGPPWWHQRSIKNAASLFDCFFVHQGPKLGGSQDHLLNDPRVLKKAVKVPHGLYRFPRAERSREEIREELKTDLNSQVWLVFGHLRDGKNLDLILKALQGSPLDTLWVIGKEQSSEQRKVHEYQAMAITMKVDSQCRWIHQHLPESEVGNYFQACDGVLLTYSKDFRSSSGVLSHAVRYRRPVIASGGESAFIDEVNEYRLGKVIEADSALAISEAMKQGFTMEVVPEWDRYESDHGWEENARIVLESIGLDHEKS